MTVRVHRGQARVLRAPAGHSLVIVAARRWGKDWVSARRFVASLLDDSQAGGGEVGADYSVGIPALSYWIVAPTYKLLEVPYRSLILALREAGFRDSGLVIRRGEGVIWLPWIGARIALRSADNPDSLVSESLSGVWISEASRMRPDAWHEGIRPALSDRGGWAIINTTPRGHDWVYALRKEIGEGRHDGWDYIHGTYRDQTIIPGYVERVEEQRATMSAALFARSYEADFSAFQGQVFEAVAAHHRVSELPARSYAYVLGGYDHGHTHRAALAVVGITADWQVDIVYADGFRGVPFVLPAGGDSIYGRIKDLTERYQVDRWYCSHERPENVATLRSGGLPAASWMSDADHDRFFGGGGDSRRTDRYMLLNQLFAADRVRYLESQAELQADLETVSWKALPDGSFSADAIVPVNDDVTDAVTMALYGHAPIRRALARALGAEVA